MKTQMIDKNPAVDPDVIDAILDLKHDLGKHIRLPVSLLPEDASDAELRETVTRALTKTRSGPTGTRSARDIWEGFVAEAVGAVSSRKAFAPLLESVARALEWEGRAAAGEALDRRSLALELEAVGTRIQELLDEVSHG